MFLDLSPGILFSITNRKSSEPIKSYNPEFVIFHLFSSFSFFFPFLTDRNKEVNKRFFKSHGKTEHVIFFILPLKLWIFHIVYLRLNTVNKTSFLKFRLQIHVDKFAPCETNQLTTEICLKAHGNPGEHFSL